MLRNPLKKKLFKKRFAELEQLWSKAARYAGPGMPAIATVEQFNHEASDCYARNLYA